MSNTDLHGAMPELPELPAHLGFSDLVRAAGPVYTADQMREYARAAIQQAAAPAVDEETAFDRWLKDKCPSGDVTEVQNQWEDSYEYAEWLEDQAALAASPTPPKQQPALGRGEVGGVPLSEAKLGELYRAALDHWDDDLINVTFYFARAIEAAHGIGIAPRPSAPTGQINPDSVAQGMEGGA